MRRLLATALLFVIGLAYAGSNPPTPTPAKSGNPYQKSTTKASDYSSKKEDPADKYALSVELLNTGKSADERQHEAETEKNRASREWWTIGISLGSLFVTIALAVITGLLAKYTYLLWKTTKRLATDASNSSQRQAAEMQQSIVIAKQMADAAESQVAITARQTDIQAKQHAVGRLQFLATHRPKIILRDAFCENNEIGDEITVTYVIVNVGESPARIVESKMEVRLITTEGSGFGPHPRISLNEGENEIGDFSIEPGEGKILIHNSGRKWQAFARHEFANQEFGVFFCGDIAYEDSRDIKRHAMFFRKYDLGQCRFFQINTPTMRALDNSD